MAWDKNHGAIASAGSNITGEMTPKKTHPEARAIEEKARGIQKYYRDRRRKSKVIYHEIPEDK